MRILSHEIRKVFTLKMFALLIVISAIIYQLFISFYFQYFPNGRPFLDYYRISVQMLKDYGTHMDETEFLHFQQQYKEQVEEANHYLQSNKGFVDAGITTYEDFRNTVFNSDLEALRSDAYNKSRVDIFYELQAREGLIQKYENKETDKLRAYAYPSPIKEEQAARIEQLVNNESITAIFPHLVFENYNTLITYVAVLVVLSVSFMISPMFIKDRKNHVIDLQYTAKTGRPLFKKKIAAAMVSSCLITTAQLLCFFLLYSANHVSMFFNSNINSVFNYGAYWYDLTFIQYIVLTVVALYVLGMIVTLLTLLISSLAPNYITIIGAQVPLLFILLKLLLDVLIGDSINIRYPQYVQPLLYLSLAAAAVIMVIVRWKKEQVADIKG
ncbi:hypothetical protein [Paenibacillus eucommiae]|uniref:ABC-type multidrug transport system fused ATPase/permease subunit n=1 Tax=Paenibacillus eucommiae TaxID=1355755 RepID=A0ABS4J1B7_9BACL|nr:hypothetical protein [Paenibacillus eucommiae]MBP1993638.1 ABC-type multidrug transport system fused ATPase/permease subunit [Paenibacillus eucommiae]